MIGQMVFPEPQNPGPPFIRAAQPLVNWYIQSGHDDARRARDLINSCYASFPGRSEKFLKKLRSTKAEEHWSAVDELFLHTQLQDRFTVAYEEPGPAGTVPDFRLYKPGGQLYASAEVLSFFQNKDWTGDAARSGRLEDALNDAIPVGGWYLGYEIYQWDPKQEPKFKPIIHWINQQLAQLPAPSEVPTADFHHREYRDRRRGVRIVFSFLQRMKPYPPRAGEAVVWSPASIGGFGGAPQRLLTALGKKVDKKYEKIGKPFALIVANHDFACDSDDIYQAVLGKGGLFSDPSRNTSISAVYVLHRWAPHHQQRPKYFQLSNPHTRHRFTENLFPDALELGINGMAQLTAASVH